MSNNVVPSGKIKRIFVQTFDTVTSARFTLEGHKTIFDIKTSESKIREELELTVPGDDVFFEYQLTGLIFKENSFLKFKNLTLDSELNKAN